VINNKFLSMMTMDVNGLNQPEIFNEAPNHVMEPLMSKHNVYVYIYSDVYGWSLTIKKFLIKLLLMKSIIDF
jgi:hypothetical protein